MSTMQKVKQTSESLPCQLNDEELLKFGEALAGASQAVASADNAKKSAMKQHNYEIQLAQTRRDLLSNIVASKIEYRDIPVEERWDWETEKYTRTRKDTGEVVFERGLTTDEKQMELVDLENEE